MLAVSGAFPLTSDQPPLAVVLPKTLAGLMPGWDRVGAARTAASSARPEVSGMDTDLGDQLGPSWAVLPQRNPFAIAGPPPSFEANVLELERRFEAILARIELARAQRELRLGSHRAEAEPTLPDLAARETEGAVEPSAETGGERAEIILLRDWRGTTGKAEQTADPALKAHHTETDAPLAEAEPDRPIFA